jgi:penicillin-binding protein 1C
LVTAPAARLYFDKAAQSLSLAEAALLAGIPRAPSIANPFTDRPRAVERQRAVLRQMAEAGVIDAAQHAAALAQPLRLAHREDRFSAPHFTTWALGRSPPPGRIPTTLDLDLQTEVRRAARRVVRELAAHRVTQAAAVVLDNETGDILAWLGSVDFFEPGAGQVDMVVGLRQPGSTLKPFVYGLAIEDGFSANTEVPDFPLYFATLSGDYRPRNYDRRFHGWVTLRAALANSYNVPAVWMVNRLGAPRLLQRLHAVGFSELDRDAAFYGLGLGLGNGEVILLHLANAYRTLARGGEWSAVRWRRDAAVGEPKRVMPAPVAALLTDILSDGAARASAFGYDTPLDVPFPAAAKTGTSTDFTDNWTVGYTSEVTVAVWVGNFDSRPMDGISGITGAGPLWNAVMVAAMAGRDPQPFHRGGLERVRFCRETGTPWTPECAHGFDEWVVPGQATRVPNKTLVRSARVVFPDHGDVFQRDADVPARLAGIRLRAEAPESVNAIVWEMDGRPHAEVSRPLELWWSLAPGTHQLRVWPRGQPEAASPMVTFEVLP